MSNTSIAKKIFTANIVKLQSGDYKAVDELRPYKAFRQETIKMIADSIDCESDKVTNTASTMFNTIRKATIAANPALEPILKRGKALGRVKAES